MSSVTLVEFTDQVSEALAMRLPLIQEIKEKPYRVVIEMGDIENDTNTPSRDFRIIRRRMYNTMVSNQMIQDTAEIRERMSRNYQLRSQYRQSEQQDLLDEGINDASDLAMEDMNDVYILYGTFGEIRRGAASTYLFDVSIQNLGTREIVFNESFDARQMR